MNIYPNTLTDLKFCMEKCEQAKGLSVYDHGLAVFSAFVKIREHLLDNKCIPEGWRIPDWAYELKEHLIGMDESLLSDYMIWHDCGKPFTLKLDSDGRRHFPNHANMSHDIWLNIHDVTQPDGSRHKRIAMLMKHDMDFHTLKREGIQKFKQHPDYIILMFAGLSEIHANAEMFGGLDSDNFKIKAKHIAKRGKQITSHNGENNE